jgi:hypothetical protein
MRNGLALVGVLLLSSVWSAGRASAAPPEAGTDGARSPGSLSQDQMKAFADLTGDSPYRISGRFATDPNLIPLAAKAADARMSRKTTGLIMTIVGFTILGAGEIASSVILVTTPGYPDMQGHERRFLLGAAIAAGSLGVGLALGIPGIMKMVRTTQEEERALDAYSPARPDLSARPAISSSRALVAPLFGLAF